MLKFHSPQEVSLLKNLGDSGDSPAVLSPKDSLDSLISQRSESNQ